MICCEISDIQSHWRVFIIFHKSCHQPERVSEPNNPALIPFSIMSYQLILLLLYSIMSYVAVVLISCDFRRELQATSIAGSRSEGLTFRYQVLIVHCLPWIMPLSRLFRRYEGSALRPKCSRSLSGSLESWPTSSVRLWTLSLGPPLNVWRESSLRFRIRLKLF